MVPGKSNGRHRGPGKEPEAQESARGHVVCAEADKQILLAHKTLENVPAIGENILVKGPEPVGSRHE